MECNLNSMLAAYEALPDKATTHARGLSMLVARVADDMRAEVRRMILAIFRVERWPLFCLDEELMALNAMPIKYLEEYRSTIQRQYEATTDATA